MLFKFFMFKSSEGEKQGGGTGSFININILICEGGRESLSSLAAFKSCCGAFFSLSVPLALFSLLSFSAILVTGFLIFGIFSRCSVTDRLTDCYILL